MAIFFLIQPHSHLMAFTGVTNAHGPSPQPTACRSPSYSLATATGSNQATKQVLNLPCPRSLGWMGEQIRCQHILVSSFACTPPWWSSLAIITSNHCISRVYPMMQHPVQPWNQCLALPNKHRIFCQNLNTGIAGKFRSLFLFFSTSFVQLNKYW